MENMFNVLLATLAGSKANRETFREKEGFELMVRCMKEKNHAGTCALRVLDVAIQDSPASAEAFVGAEGLKVLFPAFMGTTSSLSSTSNLKLEFDSIVSRECPGGSGAGTPSEKRRTLSSISDDLRPPVLVLCRPPVLVLSLADQ